MTKIAITCLASCLALAAAALAAPGFAAPAADLCPSGDVTIVRISRIPPTGSLAGFRKAVADHAKWYADHGYAEDRIVAAPILKFDPASQQMTRLTDQMITFHFHSKLAPPDKRDAAWDAYVAEYRANSEITTETIACMPK